MTNVDIVIRSIDQTKGSLTKVSKETNTLAGSLKAVATNAAVVTAAIAIATQSYDKLITQTQKYNQEVLDMMISTKETAEETSKLIQVVDDTGVSYETLKNAMKLAIKNGVEPNIEGIASLADEYNNLKDPVKQGQLLMDKFGKSGLEMGRVMVLGGDALRKMSSEMSGGLVLTQENIDASEEYRKNVDELSDSWQGFTVRIGNEVLPALNDMIDAMQRQDGDIKNGIITTGRFGTQAGNAAKSAEILASKTDSATESYIAYAKAMGLVIEQDFAAEIIAQEDAMKNLSEANQNFLSGMQNIQSAEESYSSKTKSLTEERIQLEQDRAIAIAQGWWVSSEKVKDYDAALEENKQKVLDNEAEHKRANSEILLGLAERKFMQDGVLDDKEFNWLLDKGVAWGVYSATAIEEMKKAEDEIAILTNGLNGLPTAKDIRINVITSGGAILDLANSPVQAPRGTGRNSHASGGDFLIPMSYGNEGFRMGNGDTASGGERVSITPRGGNPNADVIAAIERNRVSEERLVQLFENAVLRVMK